MPNQPCQSELESRAKSGDQEALAQLFAIFRARLRRVVDVRLDNRLKGRVDASDVVQEAYIDLAKKLPRYVENNSSMSLFVWMRLVATERVLITHRQHFDSAGRDVRRENPKEKFAASSMFLAENLLAVFGSAENQVLQNEMFDVLKATIEQMDPIDHEIIAMRCFEELTNAEAAEALQISPNGASSRFVRAMTKLKKKMNQIPGLTDCTET